jgi:L-fuculose-phosphate aldolase
VSAGGPGLAQAARELHGSGMNLGTAGNLSERTVDGMRITPSGLPYAQLHADDLVRMTLDGRVLQAEAGRTPSSEWRFHAAIYREFAGAGAVVHAHSTHATSLACLGRGIPAFHYEVALAGGSDIRCAAYATFGTPELAENLLEALRGRQACLLANHGLVAWGQDLAAAISLATKVEQLAQMYLQCLQVGEPRILDDEEIEHVLQQYRHYARGGR